MYISDEVCSGSDLQNTDEKTIIGVVPGNGGAEYAFFKCIERVNIDETLEWYNGMVIEKDEFDYRYYGINNREDFEKIYHR